MRGDVGLLTAHTNPPGAKSLSGRPRALSAAFVVVLSDLVWGHFSFLRLTGQMLFVVPHKTPDWMQFLKAS